jgi:cytochrome P450
VLTGEELLAQCTLLLVAGHETTRNLLGNGLLALLQYPDQFAKLKENPALMNSAVREFARFDSPVQFSGRAATEDFTWHDQLLERTSGLRLLDDVPDWRSNLNSRLESTTVVVVSAVVELWFRFVKHV